MTKEERLPLIIAAHERWKAAQERGRRTLGEREDRLMQWYPEFDGVDAAIERFAYRDEEEAA